MYRRFYLEAKSEDYYLRGRGYRSQDVLAAVSESGRVGFFTVLRRYVSGTADLEYDRGLGYAGLRLERVGEGHRIVEKPGATDAKRAFRRAWLSGKAAAAAAP